MRRIVRQSSGTREHGGQYTNSTERTKRIHIEIDDDGTEGTSGTCYIRPPRAIVIIKYPGTHKGWRFTPTDTATAEGSWNYKAHIGPIYQVGRMPSWGSRVQVEQRNDTTEAPDGRWESTQLAPPRAIWTGGWSDPFWRGYVQASSNSPPWRIPVEDDDAERSPARPAGYAEGELPGMLRGLLDELRGSETPVVWMPKLARLWFESGNVPDNPYSWPSNLLTIQRCNGAIYGVIVSDLDVQHHSGEEYIADAVRLGTLEVRELR